jgi:hypothetical protein
VEFAAWRQFLGHSAEWRIQTKPSSLTELKTEIGVPGNQLSRPESARQNVKKENAVQRTLEIFGGPPEIFD